RARGVDVLTYSIRRPCPEDLSAEVRGYLADTEYILPVPIWTLLATHLSTLCTRPRLYLRVLMAVLTGSHERSSDRFRSLAHFAEAVTLIAVLRRSGVDRLHAHFAVGSATCAWVLARFLDLPFSMTAHAYDIWCDRLLLPEKLRAADCVVTCTECNRQY